MPDENAIGPGQSNYQIAGKTRQTVCVINVGTRGSTSVTLGPSCARVGPFYQKPIMGPVKFSFTIFRFHLRAHCAMLSKQPSFTAILLSK